MAVVYDISRIDAMDGHEFEHFIAVLLRELGYEDVEVTRGSGDQGVDVLAEKEGVRYAVQCKCYSSDLGNTPVQEVNTGKVIYHCHVGVVVTNRYFTQGARDAAKATGVLLWDRSKLEQLIAQAELKVEPLKQQSKDSLTLWNGNPLLKRGAIALGDKEWKKARQFFDRVLNTDPENAEAYLGLVMVEMQLPGKLEFEQLYVQKNGRIDGNDMKHTREFANPALKAWFSELEKQIEEKRARERETLAKELERRIKIQERRAKIQGRQTKELAEQPSFSPFSAYSGIHKKVEADAKQKTQEECDKEYKQSILTYLSANSELAVTSAYIMMKVLYPAYLDVPWSSEKAEILLNDLCDKEGKLIRVKDKLGNDAFKLVSADEAERKRKKAEAERLRQLEQAEEERRRQEDERAEKRATLEAEQAMLQTERTSLRGLFTGRRRREIETRLGEIELELSRLC